jgi:hypothetical protein
MGKKYIKRNARSNPFVGIVSPPPHSAFTGRLYLRLTEKKEGKILALATWVERGRRRLQKSVGLLQYIASKLYLNHIHKVQY